MDHSEQVGRIADIVYGLLETEPLHIHERVLGFGDSAQESPHVVLHKGEWCVSFGGLIIPFHFSDDEVRAYVGELIRRYKLVF